MSEINHDLCELCCRTLQADDDTVVMTTTSEGLDPTGSYLSHRRCWQLACSLGSQREAREVLGARTSDRVGPRAMRVQPRPSAQRTIQIRPARMLVNTLQIGTLFPHVKRVRVLPA